MKTLTTLTAVAALIVGMSIAGAQSPSGMPGDSIAKQHDQGFREQRQRDEKYRQQDR